MTRRVIADRRAGVMVMFALAATTLVLFVGLAVDATRVWMVRAKLQQAVDVAALLAVVPSDASVEMRMKDAGALFRVNFGRSGPDGKNVYMGATVREVKFDPKDARGALVEVTAIADVPMTFMRSVKLGAGVVSRASAQQGATFEIALALDVTGTMLASAGGGLTKVQAVKNAVANMLDIIYGPSDTVPNLWFSVVPFRGSVNMGPRGTRDLAWVEADAYSPLDWTAQAWRGCVEARRDGFDLTEDSPATKPFRPLLWKSTYQARCESRDADGVCTRYYPGTNDWRTDPGGITDTGDGGGATNAWSGLPFGPNLGCSNEAVLPLTRSRSAVGTKVSNMIAASGGSTVISQGLQWSWFTLSPKWRIQWGLPPARPGDPAPPLDYGTSNARKVIILMSDGANNWGTNVLDSKNYGCRSAVWPECVQTDGYYNSYGQLSENRLGIVMPDGSPPVSSFHARNSATTALDVKTTQICRRLKTLRIEIYTIAFQAGAGSTAERLLQGCATDAAHYFNANNGADINRAFTTIARQLRNLRLAQ